MSTSLKRWCGSVGWLLAGAASLMAQLQTPPLPPGMTNRPPSVTAPGSPPSPAVAPPAPAARAVLPPQSASAPAALPARPAAAPPANTSGARIKFDIQNYDFGRAMWGEPVDHTYYFTNVGTELLIVSNVQATCHCSTPGAWTREAKPGESGQIPVRFDTRAFNPMGLNSEARKVFTVTCNDPTQHVVPLQLNGIVWRPVEVNPGMIALVIKPDIGSATVVAHVTNHLEQPLFLLPPESSLPALGAELRTNIPGKDYSLIVSNTMAMPPGLVQGYVHLKTGPTNAPAASVLVSINAQAPVGVFPTRLDLRPAPLPTNQVAYVTIVNNCTNPITLSEASVNLSNVTVRVTENQPGHYFTVLLDFPPGLEVPTGQSPAFTVKTTSPKFPLVKVPILQQPRPRPGPVVLQRPNIASPTPPARPPAVAPAGMPSPLAPPAAMARPVAPPARAARPVVPPMPPAGAASPAVPPMPPADGPVPAALGPIPGLDMSLPAPGPATPGPGLPPPASAGSPRIKFDASVFDFGRVVQGEVAKHTFYFTNAGSGTLILNNVQATCHCSTAGEWTREVQPGETGQIPVQFDSHGVSGPFARAFIVTCNDKTEPSPSVQVKGTIWKPVDVSPGLLVLTPKPDSPFVTATARITNGLEQPLLLSPPESTLRQVSAVLVTNVLGKDYSLIVTNNVEVPPGTVQGYVHLKTSCTNTPVINLQVWINSQAPLAVYPGTVDLRSASFAASNVRYVTLINNSTNPITLSEPTVNVSNVVATVNETKRGFYFSVLLSFPPGFEVPNDQPATFTVKTTSPQVPLVKVPIIPPTRPHPATRPVPGPVVPRRPGTTPPVPVGPLPQPPRPAGP